MKRNGPRIAALAVVALAACRAAAAPADPPPLSALSQAVGRVEAVQMLSAILRGEPVGPGSGWFHPAQSLYDWKWLAGPWTPTTTAPSRPKSSPGRGSCSTASTATATAGSPPTTSTGPTRRRTGASRATARQLLRRADGDGDGKLSAEEWQTLFRQAAKGKDKVTADDLRALLFPPQPKMSGPPSDMPSRSTLLLGLFKGEIGSPSVGPAVGGPAPDFTLRTPDGKELALRDYRADRPLVLVFGSFT